MYAGPMGVRGECKFQFIVRSSASLLCLSKRLTRNFERLKFRVSA